MKKGKFLKQDLPKKKRSKFLALNCFTVCLLSGGFLMALPVDSKGSTPPLSAKSIEKAVQRALILDDGIPAHLIDVELQRGVVSLTGIVPHLGAKERATLVTETIKGVNSVVNQIKITPLKRPDAELKSDILDALQEDPATENFRIAVAANQGKVVLTGEVSSLALRELARDIAAGVWGVLSVENHLQITPRVARNDQTIKEEISRLLEHNVWINENPIEVSVEHGVVTLEGVVGSASEKRRVHRVAMVNGVKAIQDDGLFTKQWAKGEVRRTRQLAKKTDDEIREFLTAAFRIHPYISLGHLTVEIQESVVGLYGKVPHLKIKKEAERVVQHTRGVAWVENFIKVRPKRSLSDEDIKRKVNRALARNAYVNHRNITAWTFNGKVFLAGTAHSNFEKQEAERTIENLKGVIEIESQISVKETWLWKPDKIITKDVKDELWWSPFIDSEEITVQVKDGTVTLSGTVDSWWEREMAVRNAYQGGAKYVESELLIQ